MEAAAVAPSLPESTEEPLRVDNETTSSPAPVRSVSEDWMCPICMDYMMDPVQTGCSHIFCRFCIDRWIIVNPGRKCPVCRSPIGTFTSLPELDATITTSILDTISPEEAAQRCRVRAEREVSRIRRIEQVLLPSRNWHNFFRSRDSQEPAGVQASQLVNNALQNSVEAAEHEIELQRANMYQSQYHHPLEPHPNPWTPIGAPPPRATADLIDRLRVSIERLQALTDDEQPQHEIPTRDTNRPPSRGRASHDFNNISETTRRSSLERPWTGGSAATAISDGSRLPPHIRLSNNYNLRARETALHHQQLEDATFSEYNYHARRVQSAYSRLVEAQQDYDFHRDELARIHEHSVANSVESSNGLDEEVDPGYDSDLEEYPINVTPNSYRRRRTPASLRSSRMVSRDSVTIDETESLSAPDFVRSIRRHPPERDSDERPHLYSQPSSRSQRRNSGRRTSSSRRYSAMTDSEYAGSMLDSEPSTGSILSEIERDASSLRDLRLTRELVNLPQWAERDSDSAVSNFSRFRRMLSSTSPIRSWTASSQEDNEIICPNSDTGSASVRTEIDQGSGSRARSRRRSVQFQIHRETDEVPDHEISQPRPLSPNFYRPRNFRRNSSIGQSTRPHSLGSSILTPVLSNSTIFTPSTPASTSRVNDILPSTEQVNISSNNNNSSLFPLQMIRSSRRRLLAKLEKRQNGDFP